MSTSTSINAEQQQQRADLLLIKGDRHTQTGRKEESTATETTTAAATATETLSTADTRTVVEPTTTVEH